MPRRVFTLTLLFACWSQPDLAGEANVADYDATVVNSGSGVWVRATPVPDGNIGALNNGQSARVTHHVSGGSIDWRRLAWTSSRHGYVPATHLKRKERSTSASSSISSGSGVRITNLGNDQSAGTSSGDGKWCAGRPHPNLGLARQKFHDGCGQRWNDQIGPVCQPQPDGYHCSGVLATRSVPYAPADVRMMSWDDRTVHVRWGNYRGNVSLKEYGVFRDGVKIGSPGKRQLIDTGVYHRPTYAFVAVNRNGMPNPSGRAKPRLKRDRGSEESLTIPVPSNE